MGGGGGGGNTTTQTSGVPDWLRPDVERAFGAATSEFDRGALSRTAAHDDLYGDQGALATQEALGRQAIAGEGIYDIEAGTQRQLENLQGANLAGRANTGTLGSARADRAQQAALADKASQFQQARQQQASQGVGALRDAAGARQELQQRQLDLPHQGLQRLFGYYGSGAAGTTTEQSGGGGK